MKVKLACGHSIIPHDTKVDLSNKICGSCSLLQKEIKYLEEITGLKVFISQERKKSPLKCFQFKSENRVLFDAFGYKKAKAFAIGYVCGKNSYNIT